MDFEFWIKWMIGNNKTTYNRTANEYTQKNKPTQRIPPPILHKCKYTGYAALEVKHQND